MEREKIIKIKEEELDNQPMASQRVIEARDALDDALEEYIVAVQEDAFYWGYMTAMKRCNRQEGQLMDNIEFRDLVDELYNTNNFLEMCYGYAQSDTPCMKALAESLQTLKNKYEEIYARLCYIDEVK